MSGANTGSGSREGSLEAPTRHPIDWQNPEFYDEAKLFTELERVFDICHGCRRCFSLCNSFPTLVDAVDAPVPINGTAAQSTVATPVAVAPPLRVAINA